MEKYLPAPGHRLIFFSCHDYIGAEHLLLGLFCDSDAAVVQALATLGGRENEVRAAITGLPAESGPEPALPDR